MSHILTFIIKSLLYFLYLKIKKKYSLGFADREQIV